MDPYLAAFTLHKDKAIQNLHALSELLKFSIVSISSLFFPISYASVGIVAGTLVDPVKSQEVINFIVNMLFIYIFILLAIFIFYYAKYIECRYQFSTCFIKSVVEDIRSKTPTMTINYEEMCNHIVFISDFPKDRVMTSLIKLYPLPETEGQDKPISPP